MLGEDNDCTGEDNSDGLSKQTDGMKRVAARQLIERYYYQLTQGCGQNCGNVDCLSGGNMSVPLSPNEAAARALHLLKVKARLCETSPSKVARTEAMEVEPPCNEAFNQPQPGTSKTCIEHPKMIVTLDETKLDKLLQDCSSTNNYSPLLKTLWDVFSSPESLASSWPSDGGQDPPQPLSTTIDLASLELKKMTKEEVRSLEGENEKDVDSSEAEKAKKPASKDTGKVCQCTVDIEALRRSYDKLFALENSIFESGLVNALVMLCSNLEMDLKCKPNIDQELNFLNLYEIILELPVLGCEAYLENVIPLVCRGVALLPVSSQVSLVRSWSKHSAARLRSMLENLQQILSLKVYTGTFTRDHLINQDETITSTTTVIRIIYYASLVGGIVDSTTDSWDNTELPPMDEHFGGVDPGSSTRKIKYHDEISAQLEISPMDCRVPLIPLEEFYNEPLNEQIEMDRDFACWKMTDSGEKTKFSFMAHPFILNPATKAQALYYDNRIRMYSERRLNLFHSMMSGTMQSNPYLKLQVRRDHIVEDALVELEVVVMENPQDLKKQLVVEFEAEQGIDEGGVSKEFFQLIVEEIFNPDYGMFIYSPESQCFWFNPTSFESDAQFTLIGIVLGLAIYNNVILDLHLPSVIYRKLAGKKGLLEDLKDFKPSVYQGLKDLLTYQGEDMEDVFVQPFQISYTDLFDTVITMDLKEGGGNLLVNQANKQEYVELYADFLLNKSVEKQYLALKRGFLMVTAESPLSMMFTPAELEMLVCGEKEFDFNDLENSTEYDGGFSSTTEAVRWFWSAVHEMDLEDKRRLLQFTTGSDRIPVGGLAKLKLIIARNGPDSERLPSAHTCFNVLLLPEYSSKEKLTDLLMKAIKECKGFGML